MMCLKDKVSVIIPVYQSKNYLTQCMESILKQTYKNLEIILVDDGSVDGSSQLCDEYVQKYNNVFCIHQENKGVSSARNAGMDNAKGEYIIFVDSDDYIATDYIENAITEFADADIDLYLCGYQNIRRNGKIAEKKYYPVIDEGKWNRDDIGDVIVSLFRTTTLHAIGTKIYKREIIERYHIRFKKNWKYYEDIYFCLSYLYRCRKIYAHNEIMYYYRKDVSDSLSTQKNNLQYENVHKTYILLEKFMKLNNKEAKNRKVFYEMYLEEVNICLNSRIATEKHYTINLHRLFEVLSKDEFYNDSLKDIGKVEFFCLNHKLYFMTYFIHKIKFYSQIETQKF